MLKSIHIKVELKKFKTASQARTCAGRVNAPNTEIGAARNGEEFSPVVFLRADQAFMAQRIMERGVAVAPIEVMEEMNVAS